MWQMAAQTTTCAARPRSIWAFGIAAFAAWAGLVPWPAGAAESKKDLRLRGECATFAGDQTRALEIWRELLADDPEDPGLLLRLGMTQSLLGRYDEAEATLIKAHGIQPANPHVVYNLGLMYFRKGSLDRAEEHLRQTLSMDPRYPEAYFHLGLLCEDGGKKGEALKLYLKELEVNPGCSSAWAHVLAMRSKGSHRELSGQAAVAFFVACLVLSGVIWTLFWRKTGAHVSDAGRLGRHA